MSIEILPKPHLQRLPYQSTLISCLTEYDCPVSFFPFTSNFIDQVTKYGIHFIFVTNVHTVEKQVCFHRTFLNHVSGVGRQLKQAKYNRFGILGCSCCKYSKFHCFIKKRPYLSNLAIPFPEWCTLRCTGTPEKPNNVSTRCLKSITCKITVTETLEDQ